jgi:hypothetical protein
MNTATGGVGVLAHMYITIKQWYVWGWRGEQMQGAATAVALCGGWRLWYPMSPVWLSKGVHVPYMVSMMLVMQQNQCWPGRLRVCADRATVLMTVCLVTLLGVLLFCSCRAFWSWHACSLTAVLACGCPCCAAHG